MQTVSQDWLDLAAGQHRVEVRVKIDRENYPDGYWILQDNNLAPILTSADANIDVTPYPAADLDEGKLYGVTITGGLFSSQSFTIGSCVSREIEVKFVLGNAVIPRMAKIQPEVRLVNDNGDVSEWIPKGTFWLDTRELDRTTGIMTIRGYDAMLKGENVYIVPGEDVGDWPKTMTSVASEIAGLMGLTMDSRNNLDANYMMQLPTDYSMRGILGYIAAANAGNWIITDEGKLRLVRVDDTVDSADLGLSAKTYHIAEPYQAFSKVEIDLSETDYVEAGDDTGRTLEIAIPIVSTTQAQTIAADVLDALDGYIYTPLAADGAILDPAMEIGDHVTVGETTSILACQTMRLDSLCTSDVSAPGEDELDHEYPYESVGQREIKRKISNIETTFTIAVDNITGRVDDLEGNYTEISQKLDSISLSVTTTSGVASIVLSVDGSTAGSGSIDMTGYVTFTNLSTQGATTINGDNITTGTISANRIDTTDLHVQTVYNGNNLVFESEVNEISSNYTRLDIYIGDGSSSAADNAIVHIIGDNIALESPTTHQRYLIIDAQNGEILPVSPNNNSWAFGDDYNWLVSLNLRRLYFEDWGYYLYADSSGELYYRGPNGDIKLS